MKSKSVEPKSKAVPNLLTINKHGDIIDYKPPRHRRLGHKSEQSSKHSDKETDYESFEILDAEYGEFEDNDELNYSNEA